MAKNIKELMMGKKHRAKKEHEDEIEMPKKKYIKEHKRLVKELKPMAREYKQQKKDLREARKYKED
jgi:hypothetical protein